MSITANNYTIAEETVTIQLRELVGALELIVVVAGTVSPIDQLHHWATFNSARVQIQAKSGVKELGTAFPNLPMEIRPSAYPGRFYGEFRMPLTSAQLSGVEALRDRGDLNIVATLNGLSGRADVPNQFSENQQVRTTVPQSTWIATLKAANAAGTLLLEIPFPAIGATKKQQVVAEHFRKAEEYYLGGQYSECVSECRKLVENLEEPDAESVWPMLVNKDARKGMSKHDRERAIVATVKLYAHLSMHSEVQGGVREYSRSDAKLLLSVLAAIAAH